jgi:murein L,D-transpeptidase YcbB/YkuD
MASAISTRIKRARFSQPKSNQYRQAFQRAAATNLWSSQQNADRVLQRYQAARKAGFSIEAATDFAFDEVGQ